MRGSALSPAAQYRSRLIQTGAIDLCAEQLDEILSKREYDRVKQRILALSRSPSLGSPIPRPSLAKRFGAAIRVSPMGSHVIDYRQSEDGIELLALVYGPAVT